MINNIKYLKHISTSVLMVAVFMLSLTSCDFDLPEANSKPDDTPPSADFGATTTEDYLEYNFANFSISATDYEWDFGDGSTSTSQDPTHIYAEEATDEDGTPYTVTLSASDKLGVVSTVSKEIIVLKPEVPAAIIPVILNPSFDDPGDDGKYTSPWVPASAIGKVPQISSSSSFVGGKAGKFPDAGSNARIGYQPSIAVTKNTDYVITYWYSIETGDPSTITVAILGGNITEASQVAGATIASFEGTTQVGKTPFEKVDLAFNSGDNSTISIHISNTGPKTAYVEEFSAAVAAQ